MRIHGIFQVFTLGLFALSMCLFTPDMPAYAQEVKPTPPIIGIVDMQKVLRDAKAAGAIRNAVEKKRKALDGSLQKRIKNLQSEEEKLRKQKKILSAEAFQDKRAKLKRQVEDLRRASAAQAESLKRIFSKEMRKLRDQMNQSVVVVMKEAKLNMVLPRSGVLIFDERMNVTDSVLEKINAKVPTVKVDFSALSK